MTMPTDMSSKWLNKDEKVFFIDLAPMTMEANDTKSMENECWALKETRNHLNVEMKKIAKGYLKGNMYRRRCKIVSCLPIAGV